MNENLYLKAGNIRWITNCRCEEYDHCELKPLGDLPGAYRIDHPRFSRFFDEDPKPLFAKL